MPFHTPLEVEVSSHQFPSWDDELASKPSANPYQTSAFAQVGRTLGDRPLFFRAIDGSGSSAQLLAFRRSRRQIKSILPYTFLPFLGALTDDLSWTYGPVAVKGRKGIMGYAAIIDAVVTSNPLTSIVSVYPSPIQDLRAVFIRRGFSYSEYVDHLIDLSMPEEDIWLTVDRKSARYEVKSSERKGVEVICTSSGADFGVFYDGYKQARLAKGVAVFPRHQLETSFRLMSAAGMAHMFLARWHSKVVAGALLYHFAGYCVYATPWHSKDNIVNHLGANEAILWRMIKWCRDNGGRLFDLTPAPAHPSDEEAAGIRAFKEKWGGKCHVLHRYDRTRGPLALARKLRCVR
jgi:hypothetical protein